MSTIQRTTLKLEILGNESLQDLETYIDKIFDEMALKPDEKRGRQELSSSDTDPKGSLPQELRQMRQSLESMQQQLKKLDLLQTLTEEVNDLKQSLDFHVALVDVLKQDNASLRTEVNHLRTLTAKLQQDSHETQNQILDLQCRSMRDNFIIHGLPEQQKETYQMSEKLVKSFLKTNLKMEESVVQHIQLARAHRLGQLREGASRSRPIVAKLLDPRYKPVIMGRTKELRGTGLTLTDQFPPEIMRRRKLLQQALTKARSVGKKARLITDKFYIDGQLYRDSKTTYWLTGGDEAHANPQQRALEVNTVAEK